MLSPIKADLHIHSCLSPCGELEMEPRRVIPAALEKGLGLIALCDHNTSENFPAFESVAKSQGLAIIPGMEITSREEVHIVALFPSYDVAVTVQHIVYERLPGENIPHTFGDQPVINEEGEIIRFNQHLLIGATTLPVEDVVAIVHAEGGIAIAAHIDREAFSLVGQLGFIPPELGLDAVEISAQLSPAEARQQFSELGNCPLVFSSDAHRLAELGSASTNFLINAPEFHELVKALRGEEGRRIVRE